MSLIFDIITAAAWPDRRGARAIERNYPYTYILLLLLLYAYDYDYDDDDDVLKSANIF